MIFYKEPFILNEQVENEELKYVIKVFKNGNFNEAKKKLSKLNDANLVDIEKLEVSKLKKMLYIDKAGIFTALIVLIAVIYLFIDYTKI
jgi:cell division protein FtsX